MNDKQAYNLSVLAYLHPDIDLGIDINKMKGETLADICVKILNATDKENNPKYVEIPINGGYTHDQFRELLEAVRKDELLGSLKLQDYENQNSELTEEGKVSNSGFVGYAFRSADDKETYFTFAGSEGHYSSNLLKEDNAYVTEDWVDNFMTATNDSIQQKIAEDFVNKNKKGDLYVSGHSKGGNLGLHVVAKVDGFVGGATFNAAGNREDRYSEAELDRAKTAADAGVKNYVTTGDLVGNLMYSPIERIYVKVSQEPIINVNDDKIEKDKFILDKDVNVTGLSEAFIRALIDSGGFYNENTIPSSGYHFFDILEKQFFSLLNAHYLQAFQWNGDELAIADSSNIMTGITEEVSKFTANLVETSKYMSTLIKATLVNFSHSEELQELKEHNMADNILSLFEIISLNAAVTSVFPNILRPSVSEIMIRLSTFGELYENMLLGHNENNTLVGSDKANLVIVKGGDDTINAKGGNNIISAGSGDDVVKTGDGNNKILLGSGNDKVNTGNGNDMIYGGSGNDHIESTGGYNIIFAGDGDDIVKDENGASDITLGMGNGYTDITLGKGNDKAYVGNGNNKIRGNEGNDYIEAKDGDNFIDAGEGNDIVKVGNGGNSIYLGEGNDKLYAGSGYNIINTEFGNNIIETGGGDNVIIAGDGRNKITTGNGNNTIYVGADNDKIYTGLGDDEIKAKSGNNRIETSGGNNKIFGGIGIDTILTGYGNDEIYADGKNSKTGNRDYINTKGGDNKVYGGLGNDEISTGNGNDYIFGGEGNDYIFSGGGENYVYGDEGDDHIYAGKGSILVNELILGQSYYGDDNYYYQGGKLLWIDDYSGSNELHIDQKYMSDDYLITIENNYLPMAGYPAYKVPNIFISIYDKINETKVGTIRLSLGAYNSLDLISFDFGLDDKESLWKNENPDGKSSVTYTLKNWEDIPVTNRNDSNMPNEGAEELWDYLNYEGEGEYSLPNPNEIGNGQGEEANRVINTPVVINYDPLILDLDGTGINTVDVKNGAYFDMNINGTNEKVGWIDKGSGFLVLDRNKDNVINNGLELFGDSTIMSNGQRAKTGFEALADLDSNGDGVIDKNDAGYFDLKVWQDTNIDGTSNENELKSLKELGIVSINLDYKFVNEILDTNARIINSATFVFEDGRVNSISELHFESIAFDTLDKSNIEISDSILALPNMRAFGKAKSLHTEMALDKTGKLENLVTQFSNTTDVDKRDELLDSILFFISKAEDVPIDKYGSLNNGKQIEVLKYLTDAEGSILNNADNAIRYKNSYKYIKDVYYCDMIFQTTLSDYKSFFSYNDNKMVKLDSLTSLINYTYINDPDKGEVLLRDSARYLKFMETEGISGFNEFRNYFLNSKEYLDIIDTSGWNFVKFEGASYNGSDFGETIYGNDLQNFIDAGDGDDIIKAGKGNDYINGGLGNDRYIFERGDGCDRIEDLSGNDTIVFGKGIKKEDLRFEIPRYDLEISIAGTDDKLIIRNFVYMYWNGGQNRKIGMEFENERLELEDIINLARNMYGTEGNDKLVYFDNGDYTMRGEGGDDSLTTSSGNDILEGGKGDDYLSGYSGDDTYIIRLGDGNDTIYDYSGTDKIIFGEGISKENLVLEKSRNNLVVTIGESGEKVKINGYFNYGLSEEEKRDRIEEFVFANDDKLNVSEIIELATGNNTKTLSASPYQINANILIQEMSSFVDKDNIANETSTIINNNKSDELFINHSIDYKNA